MKTRRLCLALLLVALLPLPTLADDDGGHFQNIVPPKPVAPFVFDDQNGGQHVLADYRGHYVLLNIWATWCPPCVKEMPSLDALQTRFDPKLLAIVPLSEDRDAAIINAFYQGHSIKHLPVAVDHSGRAPSTLELHGLPTTLLIDPQGNEIARIEGDADWTAPDILSFLRNEISGKQSRP